MRAHVIFVLFVVLFVATAASAAGLGGGPLVGGWTPIENTNDPHVKEMANFAVSEYNKQSKMNLKLVGVDKAESQVVAGTNYRIVVSVKNGKAKERYQAVVWEKPWEKFKKLTSFTPVH